MTSYQTANTGVDRTPERSEGKPSRWPQDLRKRVLSLMVFRAVVISLVLGLTTVSYWVSEGLTLTPAIMSLYIIIAATYVLTLVYSLSLKKQSDPARLVDVQIIGDLLIATLLVHVTGGVQSAFSFFFPLSVIGAATVRLRQGVRIYAPIAAALYIVISLAGWLEVLPFPEGIPYTAYELNVAQFSRALGLTLAALAGISVLSANLVGQLEMATDSLENERSVSADLLSLHEDIIRSLSSGLVTFDLDGHVLSLNQAAKEILETGDEDILGRSMAEFFPGLSDEIALKGTNGRLKRSELVISRNGEKQYLGVSVSPLYNRLDFSLGQVVHFQDLTELREMEDSIKKAERLAVIGGLAAGVAHEIRNPLASISGSIELLKQTLDVDIDNQALMEIILREIDRLDGLIDELLDYANPRPLRKTTFDLRRLIDETLQVFQRDRGIENLRLEVDGDEKLELDADPEKMRQLLWNLIRNAADAAKEGGGHIHVEAKADGENAVLVVHDNGPGIANVNLQRIFDPFYTTKSTGTGLGLAIVHSIVTDHGGTVRVDSEGGNGAAFRVEVPKQLQ